MNRQEDLDRITRYLATLASAVHASNKIGFTDLNIHAEDFYRGLLSLVFECELVNANVMQMNFPAIDLVDDTKRLCVQVTSETGIGKIKDTVNKFFDEKLNEKYDTLIVIIIGDRPNYRTKQITVEGATGAMFDTTTGVYGNAELMGKIRFIPYERIEVIRKYLDKELGFERPRLANEVQTITDLIHHLSSKKDLSSTDEFKEEPDPQGKIQHRFSEHADFLKQELVSTYPVYAGIRSAAERAIGLDTAQATFIANYLKSTSNRVLTEKDNDPVKAMNAITDDLQEAMGTTGQSYDAQAIRFFILDELVRCNVFPNAKV